MSIRVRIAPSPTGPIHVGNVHTALFNWLWARKEGGKFILRFEDTDQARSKPEWEQVIYEDLKWLGITWDEGPDIGGPYGPYRQMARLDLYRKYAEQLLRDGYVYKCYCTKEELDREREEAQRKKELYKYSGRCRNLTPEQQAALEAEGRSYSLRFKVPEHEVIAWDDLIRGRIEVSTDSIGDFIIMRPNGIPVYNFAVVVDDATMHITHILRGEGHISNTPVQILLYRALGFPVPAIGHVGHMTNPEHGKLSKRKGEGSIREFREQGYLPEAMINFMALLGWTPPGAEEGQEILSVEELIEKFDIKQLTKAPSVFDLNKLNWMNGVYIRKKSVEEFANLALPFVTKAGLCTEEEARARWDWFRELMAQVQPRVTTLAEVPDHVVYFFRDEVEMDPKAEAKFLTDEVKPFFRAVRDDLQTVSWTVEAIETMIRGHMEAMGLKPKQSLQPLRVAVTGRTASPGLFETIYLIGRERSVARISRYC
ncbi:MAG TPA: glutamate--tRNA ligase [Symbiobacteriaceae bacterium]